MIFELPEQVTVPLAPIVKSVVVQPVPADAPIVTVPPVTLDVLDNVRSYVPIARVPPVALKVVMAIFDARVRVPADTVTAPKSCFVALLSVKLPVPSKVRVPPLV